MCLLTVTFVDKTLLLLPFILFRMDHIPEAKIYDSVSFILVKLGIIRNYENQGSYSVSEF